MSRREPGLVVWLTGLPASGKSTLAECLLVELERRGRVTMWLDSDDLRRVLTPAAKYTPEERDVFYDGLGYVAALSAEGGAIAIVSATAPRRRYRDQARGRVERFVEVYLRCSEATRRKRDFKGLYAGVDAGTIRSLPGLGAPYEPPLAPELSLDSAAASPEALAAEVLARILEPSPA